MQEYDSLVKLDYREEGSRRKLEEALRKTKPMKSVESLSVENVEKLTRVMQEKYEVKIREIVPQMIDGEIYHYVLVIADKSGKGLKIIYAMCIYEALVKAALYMWGLTQLGKVPRKGESE